MQDLITWWLHKQNSSSTKSPRMAFVLNIRRFIRARIGRTGSWTLVSNRHPTFEGLLDACHSFYSNQTTLVHLGSKSQFSSKHIKASISTSGIRPDSSLSQEGSGRFQPYPLDQEQRSHPRSSWERLSGDVSSHVSPTLQVSLSEFGARKMGRTLKGLQFDIWYHLILGKEFDLRNRWCLWCLCFITSMNLLKVGVRVCHLLKRSTHDSQDQKLRALGRKNWIQRRFLHGFQDIKTCL